MPLSTCSSRSPKYSFRWASGVYNRATECHARGYNFINWKLNISDQQCIYLIACNAPEWPIIRWLAKRMDEFFARRTEIDPDGENTTRMYRSIVQKVPDSTPKVLKRYLTDETT